MLTRDNAKESLKMINKRGAKFKHLGSYFLNKIKQKELKFISQNIYYEHKYVGKS